LQNLRISEVRLFKDRRGIVIRQSALYLAGQNWLACIGAESELDILLQLTIQFGVLHMPLLIQAPVFNGGDRNWRRSETFHTHGPILL
jgi:hypothetical protein